MYSVVCMSLHSACEIVVEYNSIDSHVPLISQELDQHQVVYRHLLLSTRKHHIRYYYYYSFSFLCFLIKNTEPFGFSVYLLQYNEVCSVAHHARRKI